MHAFRLLLATTVLCLGGSAQAAIKFYSASPDNGAPGDRFLNAQNICPPSQFTPDLIFGFSELDDAAAGTVTLNTLSSQERTLANFGPDQLTPIFGPGAFIFTDAANTATIAAPHVSNTSGIGSHGPSGTGPGESVEWGVISGFTATGFSFCVSSPPGICNTNGFAHGSTIPVSLPSDTYDLGTWNFDAVGDFEQSHFYIVRTTNGGTTNSGNLLSGALHGASLPALPLVGFGALACGLLAIAGRAMRGSR